MKSFEEVIASVLDVMRREKNIIKIIYHRQHVMPGYSYAM